MNRLEARAQRARETCYEHLLMEFSVDCSVASLGTRLPELDPSLRVLVLQELKAVKEYRDKWPRHVAPELLAADGSFKERAAEAAADARKALAESGVA